MIQSKPFTMIQLNNYLGQGVKLLELLKGMLNCYEENQRKVMSEKNNSDWEARLENLSFFRQFFERSKQRTPMLLLEDNDFFDSLLLKPTEENIDYPKLSQKNFSLAVKVKNVSDSSESSIVNCLSADNLEYLVVTLGGIEILKITSYDRKSFNIFINDKEIRQYYDAIPEQCLKSNKSFQIIMKLFSEKLKCEQSKLKSEQENGKKKKKKKKKKDGHKSYKKNPTIEITDESLARLWKTNGNAGAFGMESGKTTNAVEYGLEGNRKPVESSENIGKCYFKKQQYIESFRIFCQELHEELLGNQLLEKYNAIKIFLIDQKLLDKMGEVKLSYIQLRQIICCLEKILNQFDELEYEKSYVETQLSRTDEKSVLVKEATHQIGYLEPQIKLAKDSFAASNFQRAITISENLMRDCPDNAELYFLLGSSHLAMVPKNAQIQGDFLIDSAVSSVLNVDHLFMEKWEIGLAREYFYEGSRMNPDHIFLLINSAAFLDCAGEYDLALTKLLHAKKLLAEKKEPDLTDANALVLALLAKVNFNAKKYDAAKEYCNEFIEKYNGDNRFERQMKKIKEINIRLEHNDGCNIDKGKKSIEPSDCSIFSEMFKGTRTIFCKEASSLPSIEELDGLPLKGLN